jgi:hypothetical protein
MKFCSMAAAAVLAVATSGCSSNAPAAAVTTTSAAVARPRGLVSGDACLRSEACESGYCDHPMGFCEVVGVCAERFPCTKWSSLFGPSVGQLHNRDCVVAGRDVAVPAACIPRIQDERLRAPNSSVEILPAGAQ